MLFELKLRVVYLFHGEITCKKDVFNFEFIHKSIQKIKNCHNKSQDFVTFLNDTL